MRFAFHILQYLTSDSPLPPIYKVDKKYEPHGKMKFSDLVPPLLLNIVFWGKGGYPKTEVKFCMAL